MALWVLAGCVAEPPPAQPPEVDRAVFEAEVYPVLLRDCGFPACHGEPARFFRVLGPGRTRLDASTGLYDAPTSAEIDATFDRARSMLSGAPEPAQSLLVRKPLEAEAGGAAHMGRDALGRNVYASRDELGWRVIAAWAGVPLEQLPELDAGTLDAAIDDGGPDDGALDDGAIEDAAVIADGAAEDAP